MTVVHIVRQGECLASIAKQYGIGNLRAIFDHPENAELKKKRRNPNTLHPGDRLFIPERQVREYIKPTEQRHRFKIKRPKVKISLAAEDHEGKRFANAEYELVVDGKIFRGTTDANGVLEQEVPGDSRQGKLTIGAHSWDLLISHLNPLEEDTDDHGVSGAQGRLLNMGYDVAEVNGVLGTETEAALREFQAEAGIPVTGRLDAATRVKLLEIHGS